MTARTLLLLLTAACEAPSSSAPRPDRAPTTPTPPVDDMPYIDVDAMPEPDTTSPAYGGDCAPTDPAIGPDAVDVDGDGVDSDCDGQDGPSTRPGWALRATAAPGGAASAVGPDRDGDGLPDVIGTWMDGRLWTWSPLSGAVLTIEPDPSCFAFVFLHGVANAWAARAEACGDRVRWSRVDATSVAFVDVFDTRTQPSGMAAGRMDPEFTYAVVLDAPDADQEPTRVWRWRVGSTMATEWLAEVGWHGGSPAVGDLNGDGVDDLVTEVDGRLRWCPAVGGPAVDVACSDHTMPPETSSWIYVMPDADGDGRDELLLWASDRWVLVFDAVDHLDALEVAPAATFSGGRLEVVPDLTGDGVADALLVPEAGEGTPGRVHLLPGPLAPGVELDTVGTRSWAGVALGGGFGARTLVADVDGDGLLDLVIAAPGDGYGATFVVPGTELLEP